MKGSAESLAGVPPQPRTGPPAWAVRWGVGLAVCALCLAALAWTGVLLSVEYRFRAMPKLGKEAVGSQALTRYGLKAEDLLRLDPTNGEARNFYASILGMQGSYSEAIDQLQKAIRTHYVRNSLFFEADMYEKAGQYDKAEAKMAECLAVNPVDPLFNEMRLRLLNKRLEDLEKKKAAGQTIDQEAYQDAMRQFSQASLNWAIRAPNDANSFLFLGNYYVFLYRLTARNDLLQAYRAFLVGLSGAPWLNLTASPMIEPRNALATVRQILQLKLVKPYRDLP